MPADGCTIDSFIDGMEHGLKIARSCVRARIASKRGIPGNEGRIDELVLLLAALGEEAVVVAEERSAAE